MTDAMTADSWIDMALTEWMGPRCPDQHPDCPPCQVWARLDALRAVPQPPQEPTPEAVERAAVRVKPLVWDAIDDTAWLGHGVEACQFYIKLENGSYWLPGDDEEDAAEFASLEEAKAAAQADFEAIILSALTAPA